MDISKRVREIDQRLPASKVKTGLLHKVCFSLEKSDQRLLASKVKTEPP